MVYFLEEERDAASRCLRMVNDESSDHRIQLQSLARIIGVMVSLDEKDTVGAESGAKSAEQWLRSKDRLLDFEKMVLTNFRTMAGKPFAGWSKYYREILEKTNQIAEKEGMLTGMEEVQIWCKSRLGKVRMREILEGKKLVR